jgi:NADP-dependent aldehyde dehydrogenase
VRGCINRVFVGEGARAARGGEIARGWAASLLMGAGQFCTNPGVVVLPAGDRAESFIDAAQAALEEAPDQPMLTPGIASAFRAARDAMVANGRAETRIARESDPRHAAPALFVTRASDWRADHSLHEEAFGPLGVVVLTESAEEMREVARELEGQLTATLQIEDADAEAAAPLLRILERKAGRVLANGFPTGVEVCDSMVHGGPYPASTNFGATSVGTLSIRRFLRPVCFQNLPEALLPEEMRGAAQS